ncbi:MAG: tRNA lysidine(34) synthetase TilS [Flavobacteriia bacterium]|nr:MAG: tRNA lysidine(34) synthetase TilS [Flavobacteriia bacterium]
MSLTVDVSKEFSFLKGKKLLLAVSGGMDSVVLTHIIAQWGDTKIGIAHVNFQLRGNDSDGDEAFVKDMAERYNIPFYVKRINTYAYVNKHQLSVQMAARKLRYDWFETLMKSHGYDYLLTAHHLDDSIETFIININRKTGLEGLTGIKAVNGAIIRPLLDFTRYDLETYARQHQLDWRKDVTNASIKYERNHIRHRLLPAWERINPDFRADLKQTMSYLKESQYLIEDYLTTIKPQFWSENDEVVIIDLEKLHALPHSDLLLYQCLKPYDFTDWTAVKSLIKAQTGKQVRSKDYILLKNRGTLELYSPVKHPTESKTVDKTFEVNHKRYTLEVHDDQSSVDFKQPHTEYFDYEVLKKPLYIRKWQTGDYFYPLGMTGKKKLSDFFNENKISLREKEKIWLLCDAFDQIVWIIGYRIDHRYRIKSTTKHFLKISQSI